MRAGGWLVVAVLCLTSAGFAVQLAEGAAAEAGEMCGDEFQKVTTCLTYVTGKAEVPTKDCCGSVSEIKESKPSCLCFIILQIHNGNNPQLKSMGIQESRLLQLSSACKLVDASISQCPKLLQIPPSSPDYAVFANSSSSSSSSASSSTATTVRGASTPAPTYSCNGATGSKLGPHFAVLGTALAVAVYFSALPAGKPVPTVSTLG